MIGFKKIDSDKEIELIATMVDFNNDFIDVLAQPLKLAYTPKDIQKSIAKKTKAIEELIDFDIHAYKDYVNRTLYSTLFEWKKEIRDNLLTSIKIDNSLINGTASSNPLELKKLLDNSTSRKISAKTIEKQTEKAIKRYTTQHGHSLPHDILTFSARRRTDKTNKKI